MGHQGKHLIDPETGLCEICDQGAIEQVQQGKPPTKKIIYSALEDESTDRLNIDEIPQMKVNNYLLKKIFHSNITI